MTEQVDVIAQVAAGDLSFLDEGELAEFVRGQRWFGAKARDLDAFSVIEAVPLRAQADAPLLVGALIEVRFLAGTHDVYQLLLGLRPDSDGHQDAVIAHAHGWTVYDALSDPVQGRALYEIMRHSHDVESDGATSEFRTVDMEAVQRERRRRTEASVRPMGAEQSNSSLVIDDAIALKVYRRVEPGINPELELLRFLTERGFAHIAPLEGWYAYTGRLMDATLGILQEFVPGARDGWELALEEIGSDPDAFLERVRSLGTVTGQMHTTLGSDASDPAFSPEEMSAESLPLLTATVDEEIERIFRDMPDTDATAPLVGRAEDVRGALQASSRIGAGGKIIRHHGDYHLGQCLLTERGWIILDFEGEPARSLTERRVKRSALRDVAGMLRSFAYAAAAAELQRGTPAPQGWEQRAREAFLDGYREAVDPGLLPPGAVPTAQLLAVFELEKAVYELRYELNNRPDWVSIPVTGIVRLLEEAA